tara:strand:+ start:958 stop:1614 length:657 start_codon:yes stop_codon:yes gene_type:complete
MDKDKQLQSKRKKNEITHLEKIAGQIKDKVITKSNCKLCNSKYRTESEKLYENTNKNLRAVEKFLAKNSEKISYQAIRNHFKMHYEQQKMDLQVKEYIENVAKFRVEHADRKSALEERKMMLEQHMIQLAAMGQGAITSEEMRKDANALKALSDAILGIDRELAEIDRKMEPAILIIQILTKIVEAKIRKTKSQEHKSDLADILEQLSAQTEDVIVEK